MGLGGKNDNPVIYGAGSPKNRKKQTTVGPPGSAVVDISASDLSPPAFSRSFSAGDSAEKNSSDKTRDLFTLLRETLVSSKKPSQNSNSEADKQRRKEMKRLLQRRRKHKQQQQRGRSVAQGRQGDNTGTRRGDADSPRSFAPPSWVYVFIFQAYTLGLWALFALVKTATVSWEEVRRGISRVVFGRNSTLSGYRVSPSAESDFASRYEETKHRHVAGRPRLVVLGGGCAGSMMCLAAQDDFRVTLVEPSDYFEFQPARLKALVKPRTAARICSNYSRFLRRTHIVGEYVAGVDGGSVFLRDGSSIPYDYLLIATGSRAHKAEFPAIEDYLAARPKMGTESHSNNNNNRPVLARPEPGTGMVLRPSATLGRPSQTTTTTASASASASSASASADGDNRFVAVDLAEVVRLRARSSDGLVISARERDFEAAHREIARASTVLVVGGGTVGVEMVGELIDRFSTSFASPEKKKRDAASQAVRDLTEPPKRITLVHAQDRLLERSPEAATVYVEDYMARHDVEVLYSDRVVAQDGDEFLTQNGLRLQADVVIMCTGNCPNSGFLRDSPFSGSVSDRGLIQVDSDMRVRGTSNVFAAGDITFIPGQTEKLCQTASSEAMVGLANIHATERSLPYHELAIQATPMLISLGKFDAVLTYKSFAIGGFVPALMKEFVEWKEMVTFWSLSDFRVGSGKRENLSSRDAIV
jgi:NADH dehydrogenase FAD-containing subunit